MRDGRHIHLYNMDDAEKFNSSHTINQLSFGDPYPGMRPNPLDGTSRIIDEGKGEQLIAVVEAGAAPTTHELPVEWGATARGTPGSWTVTEYRTWNARCRWVCRWLRLDEDTVQKGGGRVYVSGCWTFHFLMDITAIVVCFLFFCR